MKKFLQFPKKDYEELLTFLAEKKLIEIYPKIPVVLRISATLPLTVSAAERRFSKFKLIKTNQRPIIMLERLNGLSVISIKYEFPNQISYNDVILYMTLLQKRIGG